MFRESEILLGIANMKSSILGISTVLLALGLVPPAQAQANCWWEGISLYCQDNRYDWWGDRYNRDYRYDRYYDDRYYDRFNEQRRLDNINDIYRDILGRDADYRGLRSWSREVEKGQSLSDIRREIARSREARERINQVYREVLGRNADPSGLDTWTDSLAGGSSLRDIRRQLQRSNEARNRTRNSPVYDGSTPRQPSPPSITNPVYNDPTPLRPSRPAVRDPIQSVPRQPKSPARTDPAPNQPVPQQPSQSPTDDSGSGRATPRRPRGGIR